MTISHRERRVLLAAAVVAGAVAAFVYVVQPFVAAQLRAREQLAEHRALLTRLGRVASGKDAYQRHVEALRARLRGAEPRLFRGDKPALAAAELQELLHTIGREVGVSVIRENVPLSRKSGDFTEISVELSMRGDLKAIRNFLYRLQTAPRLLTVPKLVMRSYPAPGVASLSADVQVSGYLVGDGKGG